MADTPMTQQAIFIGIDGGGTKCKLVMQDADGKQLAETISGPANICLSIDTALQSINIAIEEALAKAGLMSKRDQLALHVGFGLAGTEIPTACEAFHKRIPAYASIRLESDAYAACLGAHAGEEGAVVIVGTGTVGYKICGEQHKKISGWGFPHSNEGSGACIGLALVRQTFLWLDERCQDSPLLEAVFNHFNRDMAAFVTWANYAGATAYATLAPLFSTHLAYDDFWALAIAKAAASDIDSLIQTLLKDTPELPLCLFGGIAPILLPYLSASSTRHVIPRKLDAADGALLMIKQQVLGA
jgi:glucosamine kinase